MDKIKNINLYWNKKIKLNRIIDPLGLHKLREQQTLFFPGINTQTQRAYYYSFLTWAWITIKKNNLDNSCIKNFEKLLVLSSVYLDTSNLNTKYIYSKEFAKNFLDKDLSSFNINDFYLIGDGNYEGYGNIRYKGAIKNIYLMWENENKIIFTPLAYKVADSVQNFVKFEIEELTKEIYNKNDLNNFKKLSFQLFQNNENQKLILRKIFFGFIKNIGEKCDIDEELYSDFMNQSIIKLDFDLDISISAEDIYNYKEEDDLINPNDSSFYKREFQRIISRRTSLFYLLKIIENSKTKNNNSIKLSNIRNATFYNQIFIDNKIKKINFGKLEFAREMWEVYFHNIYFTFCFETFLELLLKILEKNPFGLKIQELTDKIDFNEIENYFLEKDLDVKNIHNNLYKFNNINLGSKFNEYTCYKNIIENKSIESKIFNLIILLILLYKRNLNFNDSQKNFIKMRTKEPLITEKVFKLLEKKSPKEFVKSLFNIIINMHKFISTMKLANNNTKSFLFVVEDDIIELYENKFSAKMMDGIWLNIYNLIEDIGLIDIKDNFVTLNEEGKRWMKKID